MKLSKLACGVFCLVLCFILILVTSCDVKTLNQIEVQGIVYERFESDEDPSFYDQWPKKAPKNINLNSPDMVGAEGEAIYLTVPHNDCYLLIEYLPSQGQQRTVGLFPTSDISCAQGRIWYRTGKGIYSCAPDRKDIRLEVPNADADILRIFPADNGKMLLKRIYRVKHPDEGRMLILETISIRDVDSEEETIIQEKGDWWDIHFWNGETMVYSVNSDEKEVSLFLFHRNEHILLEKLEYGALIQVVQSDDTLMWYSSLPTSRQLTLNQYHLSSGDQQIIEPDGLIHDLDFMFVSDKKILLFYADYLSRLYAYDLNTGEINTVFAGRNYNAAENELIIDGDSYYYLLMDNGSLSVETGRFNEK